MESGKKEEEAEPAPNLVPALSNMSDLRGCFSDKVILKLRGESFEVQKSHLMFKSQYFNTLLSDRFRDGKEREFIIQYDLDKATFQSFLDWIHDKPYPDDGLRRYFNSSLLKYKTRNFKELLGLLRLASLYAVDELLNSLSYIIISYWFQADNIIPLWLMAEELGVEDLKKAAFSLCLDIFQSLPKESILSLPLDNFEMLVKNVNLRCADSHLAYILDNWATFHGVPQEKIDAIISLKSAQNNKSSRFLQCVTGFKTKPFAYEEATVFSWDGENFKELAKLIDGSKSYVQAGTQILGRGYSIFVIGGEQLLGQGTFNHNITRYCLLTKKWFKVTRLPAPRRHMVAAFLGSKLVLVGGVGIYRVKLTSVHIFDVHTGLWNLGAEVPVDFTDFRPSCVFQNKLLIALSHIYSYDIESNEWKMVIPCGFRTINNMACCNNQLYVAVETPGQPRAVHLFFLDKNEDATKPGELIFINQAVIVGSNYNLTSIDDRIVWFVLVDGRVEVEVGELRSNTFYSRSHRDNKVWNIRFKPYVGCFNVLNPDTLFLKIDSKANDEITNKKNTDNETTCNVTTLDSS